MQSLDATFLTKTFCELKLEEVVFLLSCDDLSVETEDQVFDMIIHWIAIDVATRRGDTRLYDAYHVCESHQQMLLPENVSLTVVIADCSPLFFCNELLADHNVHETVQCHSATEMN